MYTHLFDLVFPDHHDAEASHHGERPVKRVDIVVVQVDEDQVREVGKVGNLADEIILVVQKP